MSLSQLKQRLPDVLTLLAAAAASLLLLLFVAYNATVQTYGDTQQRTLAAAASMLQDDIEKQLKAGVTLDGIIGLQHMLGKIAPDDRMITTAQVLTVRGEVVTSVPGTLPRTDNLNSASGNRISLSLDDRFAPAGSLEIVINDNAARTEVFNRFLPVFALAVLATLLTAASALAWPASSNRNAMTRVGAAFAIVSVILAVTMVSTFSSAVRAQGQTIAASIAQRLSEIPRAGLSLQDISGINALLDDYRRANPEIDAISVLLQGQAVHTSSEASADMNVPGGERFAFDAEAGSYGPGKDLAVRVTMPRSTVSHAVVRNVRDFAALFLACIIISWVMLSAISAIRQLTALPDGRQVSGERAMALAKPAFFAAVLCDFLSYAILPGIAKQRAMASGLAESMAALPFTIYFIAFAVALAPAKLAMGRFGARNMLALGLVMVSAGGIGIALSNGFAPLVICRMVCGLGQGVVLIATQEMLFAGYGHQQRSKAGSSIVVGFQTGMIAGVALGSLLAASMGQDGVFLLAAGISAFAGLGMVLLLPDSGAQQTTDLEGDGQRSWHCAAHLLRDRVFLSASFLVGIPAKAALSGIIIFALPLVLAANEFSIQEIGQITMIYAGSVVASSYLASRDFLARFTAMTIGCGIVLGAAGISLLGILAGYPAGANATAFICAVLAIGLAHGLINAPVVSLVSTAPAAQMTGAAQAATAYRLIERGGHAIGPFIAAHLMSFAGTPGDAIKLFAGGTALLGLGFMLAVMVSRSNRLQGGKTA